MNRRNFLLVNLLKMNFGGPGVCDYLGSCWQEWVNARLNTHASDPLGYQAQATSFLSANSARVGYLHYPFCRNDLVKIFTKLGLLEYEEALRVFADFECRSPSTQGNHNFTYKTHMINYDKLDNALMSIPTASLTNEKEFGIKFQEHFNVHRRWFLPNFRQRRVQETRKIKSISAPEK